jgi:hypothetical protein
MTLGTLLNLGAPFELHLQNMAKKVMSNDVSSIAGNVARGLGQGGSSCASLWVSPASGRTQEFVHVEMEWNFSVRFYRLDQFFQPSRILVSQALLSTPADGCAIVDVTTNSWLHFLRTSL